MQEITNKKFFINYAIFTLFLLIVFGILSYSIILSRKSFSKNLSVSVQKVLDEYQKGKWAVMDNVPINKPISFNSAAYEVRCNQDNTLAKAVIIRVTTFYGPLPAVFIYHQNKSVEFAGYASLHGRIGLALNSGYPDKRLEYWYKKVPEILE